MMHDVMHDAMRDMMRVAMRGAAGPALSLHHGRRAPCLARRSFPLHDKP
jgi:hypothetical protein